MNLNVHNFSLKIMFKDKRSVQLAEVCFLILVVLVPYVNSDLYEIIFKVASGFDWNIL